MTRAPMEANVERITANGVDYMVGPEQVIQGQFIATGNMPFTASQNILGYKLDVARQYLVTAWDIDTQETGASTDNTFDVFLSRVYLVNGSPSEEAMATVNLTTTADKAGDEVGRAIRSFDVPITTAGDVRLIVKIVKNGNPTDLTIYSTVRVREVYRTFSDTQGL